MLVDDVINIMIVRGLWIRFLYMISHIPRVQKRKDLKLKHHILIIILSQKSIRVGDSVPKSSKMLTVRCNKGCHQTQSFLFRIAWINE